MNTNCPRCLGPLDLPGTSRTTITRSTQICGPCCTDEAIRDGAGLAPIPADEWPVAELLAWRTA